MYLSRKIKLFFLSLCLLATSTAWPLSAKVRYVDIDLVSGTEPNLELLLHEKSFNLDLSKTQSLRARLKVKDLYKDVEKSSSFRASLYEVVGSERKFVSSQNLTLSKGVSKSRILALDVGYFAGANKNVEIDIFDTASNLVNTYSAQISAYNLDSQVQTTAGLDLDSADCAADSFDECQLDYLFQKVTFEAKPQRQVSTRVTKSEEGLYKVTIPVPRTKFKYLGRKKKVKKVTTPVTDGGSTTVGFGEILSISGIELGQSTTDSISLTYSDGILNINESSSFSSDGKLGLGGILDPQAWLHVNGGTASTPSIIINPGSLTTSPIDGAIEYDGDKLYFTKDGTRTELGAKGETGPQGPQGPTGPQGPAGSGGSGVSNGSTVNGSFSVTNGINARLFNGDVFNGGDFTGDTFNGSIFNGDTINARLFNGAVFNGGVFTGTFSGDGSGLTGVAANNGSISGITVENGMINNSTLNGTTTIVGTTNVTGDINVNGTVFAEEFNGGIFYGDGSNLTGIAANNGSSHDLTINNGTINNMTIQNGSTINGSVLLGNDLNGELQFLSNASLEDAVLNGTTVIQDGTLQITLGSPGANKVLTSDATGFATWQTPTGTPWTDAGTELYPTSGESVLIGGANTSIADIVLMADGSVTLNKQNNSSDMTVRGISDNNLLTVKASTNRVGIGYPSPSSKLHVNGQVLASSFNGTYYGDGSNLSGVLTSGGSFANGTISNGFVQDAFLNGDTIIDNGNLYITTSTPMNGYVLTSDANGLATWVSAASLSGTGDDMGTHIATQTLDMNTFDILDAGKINGTSLNISGLITGATVNGTTVNATTFNGGTFNGTFLGDGSGLTGVTASDSSTLDGYDSADFLKSNGSDAFTAGMLTFSVGTELTASSGSTIDIDGDLEVADTNISLDGASTTFTQTTGAITMSPAAGSSFGVALSGTGDFVVTTDDLYVDTSANNVGISTATPTAMLDINGHALFGSGGAVTFNETGAAVNFRVESDSDANALVVNGTTNNVGIGTLTATKKLTVNGGIYSTALQFVDGNEGASKVLTSDGSGNASWQAAAGGDADTLNGMTSDDFLRSNVSDSFGPGTLSLASGSVFNPASGSTVDIDGNLSVADTSIDFDGASTTFQAAGAMTLASTSSSISLNPTSGNNVNVNIASAGKLTVATDYFVVNALDKNVGISTSSPTAMLDINGHALLGSDGTATFNETGAAVNFRVESDTDAYALTVNGTSNNIGIGFQTPATKLAVNGSILANGTITYADEFSNTSGATIDVDWKIGNRQFLKLQHDNVTITFKKPADDRPGSFILVIEQDATGARDVSTWSGNEANVDVKWAYGAAPDLSDTAGAIDVVSCAYHMNATTSNGMFLCVPSLDFQ